MGILSFQVNLRSISCSVYRRFWASCHHLCKISSMRTQDLSDLSFLNWANQRLLKRNTLEKWARKHYRWWQVCWIWRFQKDSLLSNALHIHILMGFVVKKQKIWFKVTISWSSSSWIQPLLFTIRIVLPMAMDGGSSLKVEFRLDLLCSRLRFKVLRSWWRISRVQKTRLDLSQLPSLAKKVFRTKLKTCNNWTKITPKRISNHSTVLTPFKPPPV